jgi:hypothetical protein
MISFSRMMTNRSAQILKISADSALLAESARGGLKAIAT